MSQQEHSIPEKLLSPYNPQDTEKPIYDMWQKSGYFNPDNLPKQFKDGKPFTIIMPPPNANGRLHAGHAIFITIEDIMTRYKRMRGYRALWVPGADHAGFETQIVYEKKLEKEGRSRFKMDPQELYKEIMAFTLENKVYMEDQVRSLGASCDWSREKFTLDPDVVSEVQKTFKKMFDDGLIYRGKRSINWCTKHQTSLSDVETESVEKNDKLYYIKYGPFTVATVRPETVFGDVAVAVHPTDERYTEYIGKDIEVQHPENTITLKVIADEMVDKEFGTGALKITPAHDANDFALSQKHNLPIIETIDQYGKLTAKAGKYAGLKIAEARTKVVEDLQAMDLIEKIEDYAHNVPVCYKCATTIEPRVMDQWFVSMKPLAKLALDAYRSKQLEFIPDRYGKIFEYWMENTTDWNISRQIVWGIQIPAKICTSCDHAIADLNIGSDITCEKCGTPMRQDTDTFDTWFSSGQWPLLTLDFKHDQPFNNPHYPTDVMETGHDLVFKWVPRMVIFGLYLANKVPFTEVYMHGLANDKLGKKMSKSKGNVVDPIEYTNKYGTDALRMALIVANPAGSDIAISEDKIKGYKNFGNKIWNITRFVLDNTKTFNPDAPEKCDIRSATQVEGPIAMCKTRLNELDTFKKEITAELDSHKYHIVSEKLYHYVWDTFASDIIEASKTALKNSEISAQEKWAVEATLREILATSIKMLHPFMPFITEEIWSLLPSDLKTTDLVMIESWPA